MQVPAIADARAGREGAEQPLAEYIRSGHMDGAPLKSVHDDDPLPKILLDAGIPTVTGGHPPLSLSYVDCHNEGDAQLATEHLPSRGPAIAAIRLRPADSK